MRVITFHRTRVGGAIALIAFGCVIVQANRTVAAEDETANTRSNFDNVEILSPNLQAKLAILRVGSDRTSTNLLSIFVGLKNQASHRLEIQIQTIYKDKLGSQLNDGHASWIPMTLKPHEELEYRSASISENAVDFFVRIRNSPNT
jgi:hypothetical protein